MVKRAVLILVPLFFIFGTVFLQGKVYWDQGAIYRAYLTNTSAYILSFLYIFVILPYVLWRFGAQSKTDFVVYNDSGNA